MSQNCIPISSACTTPTPPGYMCLTIQNTSKEPVIVTQVIAPPTQPMCFTVDVGVPASVQVSINTVWQIVGQTTGTVYYESLSPESSTTVIVDGYIPAPVLFQVENLYQTLYFLVHSLHFLF